MSKDPGASASGKHTGAAHEPQAPPPQLGQAVSGGTLDPLSIPKYELPLFIPPAMPLSRSTPADKTIDYYEISVEQIQQQVLPPSMGLPKTTLFAYGAYGQPGTHS